MSVNPGDHGPASACSPECLTESYWRNRFKDSLDELRTDQSVKLVVYWKNVDGHNRTIIGTINFPGIVRRPPRYCLLGCGLALRKLGFDLDGYAPDYLYLNPERTL